MEEIVHVPDDLIATSQRAVSKSGRLAKAISSFSPRESQIELTAAIARAVCDKTILVAEAGTGTGKTFAYLIPCLLSGKKSVISTATKTLQDQLFHKDLPLLTRALGLSTRIQNLKGRANYLCRYRIALHAEEGRFMNQQCVHDLLHVREKLPNLKEGERSELPQISEDSPVWPYVTSTSDNCLGAECEYYHTCFLVNARKRALSADVVVINHHLYFADSRLKEDGFGELLPGVEVVVFDEAHQLLDIASHFYGERVGTRQLRDLLDDTLREWPVLDLANQPLKQLSTQLDALINQGIVSVRSHQERLGREQVLYNQAFMRTLEALLKFSDTLLACFERISLEEHKGLARCQERLLALRSVLKAWITPPSNRIAWLECFKHHFVLQATPVDIAESFQVVLTQQNSAYIFTSATLTTADSFDYFTHPLGLHEAKTSVLPSPFDFRKQALLYLPRDLPDPKHPHYYDGLLKKVLPIINACGGRCFFLFTSHRALQDMAERLLPKLSYPVLVQGEESKPILLARFREMGNAVLLGTATFWEGVDVKGDALSCVIIDKLPFASPSDPLIRGRMDYLKSCGLSGFDTYALPNAVLALKQGVGRLIRDTTDKGVLMIADPRLTGREYGKRIFTSLPGMRKTREEQTVLDFINELALTNEPISNGNLNEPSLGLIDGEWSGAE